MFKLLSILSLLSYTNCLSPSSVLYQEIFDYHKTTASKAEYALEVVNKIFEPFYQWFFTVTFCEFTYFENRILKYTESYGYGNPVMLLNSCPDLNTTKVKPKINKHGQTVYLVTSNELTLEGSETVIESFKRTGVFQPRTAVIFVINTPMKLNSYSYNTLLYHFQLLWTRSVTNSVLILRSDRLRMFMYNAYLHEVKEITDEKYVTHLLSTQNNDLFGHTLKLSVFRKIYVSDKTGPVACDSNLAQTVMYFMNASCKALEPRDTNTVGNLLENGTATGVTADLLDGYTDLELSSRILKTSYYGYIDTTYPFTQDELCFLVKKSEQQSAFTTTVKLITYEMIAVLTITVIIFIFVAIAAKVYESKIIHIDDKQSIGSTIMDLIKCLIRQTLDIKFYGPVYRIFVMLIMVYSLIVDCAIDGIITSAITYPRFKPDINTMSELTQTNLTIGVHNRDFAIFNKSLSAESYSAIKDRIVIFDDEKIKEFIDKRQFQYATLLRKSDALYIINKPRNMKNGRSLFHMVPECPVPCYIVYGLRYGSPYLPRVNYILHHLLKGGILQHWNEAEGYALYRNFFSAENKERKPLNNTNFMEVYIVLLLGICTSTISFFIEISWHLIKRIPKNRT